MFSWCARGQEWGKRGAALFFTFVPLLARKIIRLTRNDAITRVSAPGRRVCGPSSNLRFLWGKKTVSKVRVVDENCKFNSSVSRLI
ncbi:hypothetical protein B0H65DRAFT_449065 [Neurospora tetraspora]|uniref:Uncharacterized protein n=1 Tax=Neurospora tetraspora TaxID=94610 RepID=A0AAE0MX22_9PEZI|nr:hypothetical protein B0H65DRAFT_449065 [Neurospora tetraspora]